MGQISAAQVRHADELEKALLALQLEPKSQELWSEEIEKLIESMVVTATDLAEASTPAGSFQFACGKDFVLKANPETIGVTGADAAAKKVECCQKKTKKNAPAPTCRFHIFFLHPLCSFDHIDLC